MSVEMFCQQKCWLSTKQNALRLPSHKSTCYSPYEDIEDSERRQQEFIPSTTDLGCHQRPNQTRPTMLITPKCLRASHEPQSLLVSSLYSSQTLLASDDAKIYKIASATTVFRALISKPSDLRLFLSITAWWEKCSIQ